MLCKACLANSSNYLLVTKQLLETILKSLRHGSVFVVDVKESGIRKWRDERSWDKCSHKEWYIIYIEQLASPEGKKSLIKQVTTIKILDHQQFKVVSYHASHSQEMLIWLSTDSVLFQWLLNTFGSTQNNNGMCSEFFSH